MLLIQVKSQQLVAREGVVTVGTLDLVDEPSVLNFNVAAQVVLAQALLRAQVTVVDGLNLEQEDQTQEKEQKRDTHLERVVGGEMKLETVIVLQLGDSFAAVGERALVEGGRHHVLVIKVPQPQGLLAVQKYPENIGIKLCS